MEYIIEPQLSEVIQGRYNFYRAVDKEGLDGQIVQVKELVGNYSLSELQSQKTSLEGQLAEVQAKIDQINQL